MPKQPTQRIKMMDSVINIFFFISNNPHDYVDSIVEFKVEVVQKKELEHNLHLLFQWLDHNTNIYN